MIQNSYPYLLEFNTSVLVAFYLRYKDAMEQFRLGAEAPEAQEYLWQEVVRQHQGLFEQAPKHRDSDGTIHIWLPAHGKQGQTYHLPRYRIVQIERTLTIQLFWEGEFIDLPNFGEELIEHTLVVDERGFIPALLYHEPNIQITL